MPFYRTDNYAGTGEQTLFEVGNIKQVTIAVRGGATDDYDIDVVLAGEGVALRPRTAVIAAQAGETVQTFEGPIEAVGVTVNTNVSGDIDVEVLAASGGK